LWLDFIVTRRKFEVASEQDMKSARLATILLMGLVLMSSGCASLSPPAENFPTLHDEIEQTDKNAVQTDPLFWDILGILLEFGGQALANK
jgi:hypothetical protein